MSSPEQQLPNAFADFFKEHPGLFEPLRDIPDTKVNQLTAEFSDYEPSNENERRLLALIREHEQRGFQTFLEGTFDPLRAVRNLDQTLTVYREILGRVLGKPLEGGVRVGVDTGGKLPNEFDGNYNVFAVINSDGRMVRMVTNLGCIYLDLLAKRDENFLEEHYFPVSKHAQIIQHHLKRK